MEEIESIIIPNKNVKTVDVQKILVNLDEGESLEESEEESEEEYSEDEEEEESE